MSNLPELVADHLLAGVERQSYLASMIGGGSGFLDRRAGELVFEGRPKVRVDVVGAADPGRGTWSWAWAERPEPSSIGDTLRGFGEQHGIPELTQPVLYLGRPPTGIDAHVAGLVATPLLGGQAYHVLAQGSQHLVVVLHEPGLELPPLTVMALRTTLAAGLGHYGVDARRAIWPYLHQRSARVEIQGQRWLVSTPDGYVNSLAFDNSGQLNAFDPVAGPGGAPPPPTGRR